MTAGAGVGRSSIETFDERALLSKGKDIRQRWHCLASILFFFELFVARLLLEKNSQKE